MVNTVADDIIVNRGSAGYMNPVSGGCTAVIIDTGAYCNIVLDQIVRAVINFNTAHLILKNFTIADDLIIRSRSIESININTESAVVVNMTKINHI